MIKENESLCEDLSSEIEEIINRRNLISTIVEKHFGKIEKQKSKYSYSNGNSKEQQSYPVELSTNCNFLLYLSNVDELRENTISSKSGKGQVAMSSVCKELSVLSQSNYELLRQGGKIHQINENGKGMTGCVLTSDNVAFERIGGVSTKIGYIRVPVLQENIELLKKKYNDSNLRYLIMIIGFADFKNDGINEKTLYERFHSIANNSIKEMEDIIKIFNEPFTPETFEIACSMIERGANITRLLNDDPYSPIEANGRALK